ncbi:MAG: HAD family hydrolase [Spirochaetales bacterium]|nr:HAD family hydrolase [Spirochaetales bacterium]
MSTRALHSYKAFVFDLDGTLLDTTKDIGLALGKALGHKFTDEQVMAFVGRGLRNAVKAAVEFLGREDADIDAHTASLIGFYREVPVFYTKPYPGATELLNTLSERRIPFCVYSNKEQDLTETILGICFKGIAFSLVAGMHGPYECKPSSQAIDAFIANVGVEKSDILYIGDTEVDYKTAVNSDVDCLIVTNGMRTKADLLAGGVPEGVMVQSLQSVAERL